MARSRAEHAKGRLANAYRWENDPALIEERRRELTEAKLADYIEKVLAAFPPLTSEQRTRLAELLAPVRVNGGGVDASA